MNNVLTTNESGFSILEMLAVLTIFLILGAVSMITWNSFAPGLILSNAAEELSDAFQLSKIKALAEQNQYFVLLNYNENLYSSPDGGTYHFPANSYVVVDDDGWDGTGTRQFNLQSRYGGTHQRFAKEYIESTGNYTTDLRHNNLMEGPELYRGPLRLGRGVTFFTPVNAQYQVLRIVFDSDIPFSFWQSQFTPSNAPISFASRRTDPAYIYIRNQHYTVGNTSKDNLVHRRIIRVSEGSIKILR